MGRITIFTYNQDSSSEDIIKLFESLGAPAYCIDLWDHPKYREAMIRLSRGLKTPPVIFFNDTLIGGKDTLLALYAGGHLQQMVAGFLAVPPVIVEGLVVEPTSEPQVKDKIRDPKSKAQEALDRDIYYGKLMGMLKHSEIGLPLADRMLNLKLCRNCFVGSEMVDWIIHNLDDSLTREQAVTRGQMMMDAALFNHVEHKLPFVDGYVFYRFLEDENHFILNASEPHEGTPRHASDVAQDICTNLHSTCRMFTDTSGVDYNAVAMSAEWQSFAKLTLELQTVNLTPLGHWDRIALYINTYHALAMHGSVLVGAPKGPLAVMGFLNTIDYVIGGYAYTLNDIHHGLLRGNKVPPGGMKRPFGVGDPRLAFIIDPFDPRVHFVLNFGRGGGHKVKAYSPNNLESELQVTAEEFMEQVQIHPVKDEIHLPILFKWYRHDFGHTERDVLDWVKPFLLRDKRIQLQQALDRNNWNIVYGAAPPPWYLEANSDGPEVKALPPPPKPAIQPKQLPVPAPRPTVDPASKQLEDALAEVRRELALQQPGSGRSSYPGPMSIMYPPSPPASRVPPPMPPMERHPVWFGMYGPQVPLPPMPSLPPLPPLPQPNTLRIQPGLWENFRALPITMGFLVSSKLCFQEADPDHMGYLPANVLAEWTLTQASQQPGPPNFAIHLVSQADIDGTGRINFWIFLGIQVYLALGMAGHAHIRDWIVFMTQSYDPTYDASYAIPSARAVPRLQAAAN